MSTGKDCTDNELCTYHNLQCAYPDCAYGRAQKAQTAKTHEVAARIRVAEAAVVEAAEAEFLAFDAYSQALELRAYTDDVFDQWEAAHRRLHASVTALRVARQGVQHGA
jgi:hypothetical protein